MPSTYAHYKFGQEIRHKLTRKEKQIIDEFPDYFNIGLHGPDILFYYKPLRSNSVNQIGYSTHDKSGLIFLKMPPRFSNCIRRITATTPISME